MATSPISGKSTAALVDEAVELGASVEQINAAEKDSTKHIEVTEGKLADTHIPYGEEFDEEEAQEVAQTPEGEQQTEGPVTAEGKERAVIEAMVPRRRPGTFEPTTTSPSWMASAAWTVDEMGVAGNIYRGLVKALEQDDPEDTAKIAQHIDGLMDGVGSEYEASILGMPTFEAAERESNRLREHAYRAILRENEGIGQQLTAGLAGFVVEPTNWIPGMAVVKGLSMSTKIATAAGLTAGSTTLKKKALAWAVAGGVEETVRNAPRLYSDATYRLDQYVTDIAMGIAFGAVSPVVGHALRGSLNGTYLRRTADIAHAMGVDQMYRSTVNTATNLAAQLKGADGGLSAKVRAVDPGEAVRKAKRQAQASIDNKVKELHSNSMASPVASAVRADDAAGVTAAQTVWLDNVTAAIDRRRTGAKPEKSAAQKMLDELDEPVTPAAEASQKEFRRLLGIENEAKTAAAAASRKLQETIDANVAAGGTSTEITPAVQAAMDAVEAARKARTAASNAIDAQVSGGTKGKPTVTKIQDEATTMYQRLKEARREVVKTAQEAQRRLASAELADEARDSLEVAIRVGRDEALDALDDVGRINGIRPIRKVLNNADHTRAVGKATATARATVYDTFNAATHGLEKNLPENFSLGPRANKAIGRAYNAAGIQKGDGTWAAALEKHLLGKGHGEREKAIQKITSEWEYGVERMKEQLDADPGVTGDTLSALLRAVDSARADVRQQLDLANMIARNPYEDVVVMSPKWAAISEEWRNRGDMDAIYKGFNKSKLQWAASHQYGRLTESLPTRLLKSQSPLAQWFTLNVLETPAGFGGFVDQNPLTPAIYSEQLFDRARKPVLDGWETLMQETAKAENWNIAKRGHNKMGSAKTHTDVDRLSVDVMLEMSARNLGTESTASPAVKKFVDSLDTGYSGLHDLQNGHVVGIHDGNKINHYQHQVWDDQRMLELLETDQGRKGLEDLLRQGYLNAARTQTDGVVGSTLTPEKASILAKAMVDQKVASSIQGRGQEFAIGEEQLRGMMPELKDVVERMRKNGTPEKTVQEIIDVINKSARGELPTYAKSRMPIDLNAEATINGARVRVVDLMDHDVPQTYIRYAKEATARRALSEGTGGELNSDKAINDMIINMGLEAADLGTKVDTAAVRNVLQIMMGRDYIGQLPMDLRRARDAVNNAQMGGLGESQLAEHGLAMASGTSGLIGLLQKSRATVGGVRKLLKLELTPEQLKSRKLMAEYQEASAIYQDMYKVDRRNVHFDAQERSYKGLSKIVDTATGGKYRPLLANLQSRVTGYGVIRQFEEQVAMSALGHEMAKLFTGRVSSMSPRRLRDLGISTDAGGWLAKRFKDTVSYNDNGTVRTLNLNEWSDLDMHKFGVIMARYAGRQAQKGFVGEHSPEMMNPRIAFLMQFKSYAMLAAEKQQGRHMKFADREAAMGITLNAISSATARIIRYQSMAAAIPDERKRKAYLDRKYEDLALDTWTYMGIAGMSPFIATTGIGLYTGNNKFGGEYSVADEIPLLSYMDSYAKAVRAPLKVDNNERAARNMQVAGPLGTTAHGNFLFRTLSEMVEED